jgi:hypothetical protein
MSMARELHPMTDFPHERPRSAPQALPQDIGVLPHVKW